MTRTEAAKILERPVFGDPNCIEAIKFLEREAEAEGYRKSLLNKRVDCWCCNGRGSIYCTAGCSHTCPSCCSGARKRELTARLLAEMQLGELKDIAEELGATQ